MRHGLYQAFWRHGRDVSDPGVVAAVLAEHDMCDLTPATERKTGLKNAPTGPRITLAKEAIAVPDPAHNRIQLTLKNESVHEAPYHSLAPRGATVLQQTQTAEVKAKPYKEMLTDELFRYVQSKPRASQESIDSRIELHSRFALPVNSGMG